jgi:hypothetical protein
VVKFLVTKSVVQRRAAVPGLVLRMIFVSYVREDQQFVLPVAKELAAAGVDISVDQLQLRPGRPRDRDVHDALERCDALIVVLSPSSVASDNVMDEVSFALEPRRPSYRCCWTPAVCRSGCMASSSSIFEKLANSQWWNCRRPAARWRGSTWRGTGASG